MDWFIDFKHFVSFFLILTFVVHGLAFAILALVRRKTYYLFLTATFTFLTAIYIIRFEDWALSVPGAGFPLTWLLRAAAALCTLTYFRLIYHEEGTWLWKLTRLRQR